MVGPILAGNFVTSLIIQLPLREDGLVVIEEGMTWNLRVLSHEDITTR